MSAMDRSSSPFLRFLEEANVHLEKGRDADKALKRSLKLARDAFEADEACLAVCRPHETEASIHASLPATASWSSEPFAEFLRGRRPRLSPRTLLARIDRRERPWGVLALRNAERAFDRGLVLDVRRTGRLLSEIVQRLDRMRLSEVRAHIDRKLMEQLRPLDLFYQVLHGLRTLTRYDHSAAVLIHEADEKRFEVVAEQVSWRKGRSRRIGSHVPVDDDAMAFLLPGEVLRLEWSEGAWSEEGGAAGAEALGSLVGGAERRAMSVLVAPLSARGHALGVLVVASCHPRSLGPYEAALVQRFLPAAAVAIRNMGRAASLEAGMLEAERRSALATLARGVSHDVNNAIGSVLPLVQQMIEDAREERIDPAGFARDLDQVEASLQVCRRIFGGMLSFAQDAARSVGEGDLLRAIESMRAVLEGNMRRAGVELVLDLDPRLPHVRGSQSDLEQLVLNLASNACDAMPEGGRLELHAHRSRRSVHATVTDTGRGIPAEHLARVREPFFTTKADGNGLGLSICRSILWRLGGEMSIESEPGRGTRVELRIPLARRDEDDWTAPDLVDAAKEGSE